ncbi:MAG: hypothetical protein OEU84_00085 [Xanthomonadales bacterium]|nr:hypothetical protein [Xanthomonadales bacterium]
MIDNPIVKFLITTIIGGLIFLVPLMFLIFILGKAIGFMMIIAKPLADWLPVDTVGGVALANLLAILAVILVSFLAGLVARHTMAGDIVKTLENKVLTKIPGYAMIKGIKSGFDSSDEEGMKPVAVQLGSAERIALEIEKLPDGRSMIYIPSAPSAWSGVTQILPADQITYLNVPITQVLELTEKFGHGVDELLKKKQQAENPPA